MWSGFKIKMCFVILLKKFACSLLKHSLFRNANQEGIAFRGTRGMCVCSFANTSQFLVRMPGYFLDHGDVCVLSWLGCASKDQVRGQSFLFYFWPHIWNRFPSVRFLHTESANFFYTQYARWRGDWRCDCRLNVTSPVSCRHCGNTPDCPDDEVVCLVFSEHRCY